MTRAKDKPKEIKQITDLQPYQENANAGTQRGLSMITYSLERYGAARSIVADKNGVVGVGEHTLEAAADMGLPIKPVHTDGKELVVVVRDDLDFNSPEGRALAIADNRSSEVGIAWDTNVLMQVASEADLSALFRPDEMATLIERNQQAFEQFDPSKLPDSPEYSSEQAPQSYTLYVTCATYEHLVEAIKFVTLGHKHSIPADAKQAVINVEKEFGGVKLLEQWKTVLVDNGLVAEGTVNEGKDAGT